MQKDQPPAPEARVPANERLREPEKGVIDQRQQQIDPAGNHRVDPDVRPDANRKQPGSSDPKAEPDSGEASK